MSNRETGRLIRHFLRAYPARTAAMVALLILASLAEGIGVATLLPLLEVTVEGRASDRSGISGTMVRAVDALGIPPTLGGLLTLIVVALALKALFRWLAMRQVALTVARVAGDLRRRLLRAIMAARWRYFTAQPIGEFASALSLEAFHASSAFRHACTALSSGIQVIVYGTVALLISWEVLVLALIGGVVIAAVLNRLVHASRRIGRDYNAAYRRIAGRVTEVVQGVKAIKAMGRERPFLERLEHDATTLSGAESRLIVAQEGLSAAHEPIVAVFIAAGLFVAVTVGDQPLSTLVVMVFLFHRVVTRFHAIQTNAQAVASFEGTFWSLHGRMMEAEAEAEPPAGEDPPPPLEEGIRFDGVRFRYDREEVLRGVDLHIPAGRFVTIVGRSGVGKTTLVDLLLGLHHPTAGRILIDGTPLDRIDARAWRARVGYIPQDTLLLHDTVARNVELGGNALGRARIEAALRDAGAEGFVSRLPDGLETVIGERGAKLSGGERQRLAIARALLGLPRLLILDEATAGLDAGTEDAILDTMRALRDRVTIVAVSHHGAVADAADQVFELDDGRVRRRAAALEAP